MIHETAVIHSSAKIGNDVSIGPYSVIEGNVTIGDGTSIGPHVVIKEFVKIGRNNRIFQFASVGEIPQDLKFGGEETWLEIGDNNTIREYVTLNRGTGEGGGITRVGNNCLLMAYVHIAHDCIIGSNVIMANGVTLAGHVTIEDFAILGGLVAIHQFVRIGSYSMIGGYSAVTRDIAPFITASGNRAKPYGLNLIGLKRNGFSAEEIKELKDAYRTIFRSADPLEETVIIVREKYPESDRVQYLVDFIENSERGIHRK